MGGTYTLALTVSNFFNMSASTSLTFTKMASGTMPSISIVKQVDTFSAAAGIKLSAQLNADSVCSSSGKVCSQYHWWSCLQDPASDAW